MFPFICIFATMMKKLVIISLMLCWVLSLSAQFLNSGDTIAIISPSSATDTATINGGIRTLEKWGYPCIVAPHALADYHGFAGTIDERLSDLLWTLRTPSIKAIMCSRGGDGAAHLLSRISLDTLQQYPKMIIGFSDVTALLCAQARAGVMGIHGSMCHALKTYEGNDTVSQALRGMLAGHLPTYRIAPHPLNITGKAEGIIVGGNMSVFNDLAGSDFDPLFIDGIILFIEDTDEGMSKVDRMLHNIEIRGLQKHIQAVIVGQFNKYKHPENGFDDMYSLLNEYLQHWHIPVCYNFPVGHAHLKNFPLLTGAKATLEVTSDEVVLHYNNSH
ncbi:muramoyltetrapeptide carboxypeptidase [Xylanibacter ruminicola]|uniref:Muramoyltetrapeptide carboxypeptidase n=1 Tax=Xylanibacter ruminicola TaxID=839 RepID=A0A1H3YAR4_XYLRU|nr:LD-carboxypeptidase [Xylanibacter ruminicola]SEA08022.1 muramoyltetrapeptide carboxypeptidase [Xylanibacter ruminicola]